MDKAFDYIERYKFAIIGTVVIHVSFFFYANFSTIERPFRMADPQVEISLPLEDIDFDPEIMKQLNLNKENPVPEEVSNLAADANDTREKSHENFSTQEMDEQVENETRDLEKQFFEEWESTHESNAKDNSTADIEIEKDKNKQDNTVDKSNISTNGSNAIAGEVMVSYNLKNRKAHSLPRPGYTCNNSGTVVIDVKVDKSGSVKSATYNSSLSSSADECMVSKALRYAKKSRFNFSSSAPGTQGGTVTYKFVSR